MSCNKAPYIELPRASYKISNADICIMHNKIISKAKESFTVKSSTIQNMEDYFNYYLPIIENLLLEENEELYSNDLSLQEYITVFEKYNVLRPTTTYVDFITYTTAFLMDLKDNGYITSYFYTELILLVENSVTLSNEEIINYLDNSFANNISNQESDMKSLIIAMARSSNEIWNENNLKSMTALKPGSSTIIADAIGSLWGLPFGGVGSIIYGALFSLYENEILSPHS